MKADEPAPDADERVREQIRAARWRQGQTLADTGSAVVTLGGKATHTLVWRHVERNEGQRLVVTTQSCDMDKPLRDEPNVTAIPAFHTADKALLHYANRNSARFFLLDPKTGLVADAGVVVLIDKRVLASASPEPGLSEDPQRQAWFSRWLARRYTRLALEDAVVKAVVGPIMATIRKKLKDADTSAALAWVNEIRIRHLVPSSFYKVEMLLICDEPVPAHESEVVAKLMATIAKALDPAVAQLASWEMASLREISYADVLETDELQFDDVTFTDSA